MIGVGLKWSGRREKEYIDRYFRTSGKAKKFLVAGRSVVTGGFVLFEDGND